MNEVPPTLIIDEIDYYPPQPKKPPFNPLIILDEEIKRLKKD